MTSAKKLLEAAAGNAGGAGLDVAEVFRTFLYTGNASTQTITNGIDLSGEGGLVWIKGRTGSAKYNTLTDSERGDGKSLFTEFTNAEVSSSPANVAFNSSGFSINSNQQNLNGNGEDICSWTFRKAKKFFDVVTYTGNGSNRAIAHNLGSVPGMIIVKQTDGTTIWPVYHRGVNGGTNPENYL